jgi:hypothetical protein
MANKARKPAGYIIYEGPSEIDGAPIAVIVTGVHSKSSNAKTGAMVQTFIIRTDMHPVEAVRTGADASICGQCMHRPILAKLTGEPPCYVDTGRSVAAVFRAYLRGSYVRASALEVALLIIARMVRFGTYGDPLAAPLHIWRALITYARGHTGYTHQWLDASPRARKLFMASVDSPEEQRLAHARGWRTFRVATEPTRSPIEISCPASAEAGKRTQCADCRLCSGAHPTARSIVILDHAPGHKRRVINIAAN